MSKILQTRVQNKHDTTANWEKATSFIPLAGEIIIYDDTRRIKIGDGQNFLKDIKYIDGAYQADWNENDETAPGYVKNRTHYDTGEVGSIVVIEPETLDAPGGQSFINYLLQPDNTYIVSWNGTQYECLSEEMYIPEENYTIIFIGNMSMLGGDDSGEPFVIISSNNATMAVSLDGTESFTLGLSMVQPIVHKMDKKFLPKLDYNDTNILPMLIGRSTTGKEYNIDDVPYIAGIGAEIFNDYINNKATGEYSHAEGFNTIAGGLSSHAEGESTTASENFSHAEGYYTTASGSVSHAEGNSTTASGPESHAEGNSTTASGENSHTEGNNTEASGRDSHAEGSYTTASSSNQHVQGRYNINDPNNKYAHIVGNGTIGSNMSERTNSNAHTLDWDGNAWFAGDVYVGSTSGTNKDEGSKKLATEEYVNNITPTFTVVGTTLVVGDANSIPAAEDHSF